MIMLCEIGKDYEKSRNKIYMCKCGIFKSIRPSSVNSGNTKSCGCYRTKLLVNRSKKHLKSKTPLYNVWKGMKSRCNNKNSSGYDRYGAKGIKVCDRWLNSFENFCKDMGKRPKNYQIDRINLLGNYEPSNCRWVSVIDQANNKTTSLNISIKGEVKTLAEWCRLKNFKYLKAYGRISRGVTNPDKIFKEGRL